MAKVEIEVQHNEAANRFEAEVSGHLAVAEYIRAGEQIVFTHTEVPEELEGQGVASQLIRTALDHAREQNLEVVPSCQFVAAYIRRHPEYQPLVAEGYGA